jgi:cytidylate kinase
LKRHFFNKISASGQVNVHSRVVEAKINIAIDGYSSCGKSTLAKALAKVFNYAYIDSGAMYRAVTLYAINKGFINGEQLDEGELISALNDLEVDFINENGLSRTRLNGKIVEDEIRTMPISAMVSQVSRIKEVRAKLRLMQQKAAEKGGVVMDGRDIGSAVLPDAELKIFMVAEKEVRAMRRFEELAEKGQELSLEQVRENLEKRDYIDSNRSENPLTQTADAQLLDTTKLTEKEQLNTAIAWARELMPK